MLKNVMNLHLFLMKAGRVATEARQTPEIMATAAREMPEQRIHISRRRKLQRQGPSVRSRRHLNRSFSSRG